MLGKKVHRCCQNSQEAKYTLIYFIGKDERLGRLERNLASWEPSNRTEENTNGGTAFVCSFVVQSSFSLFCCSKLKPLKFSELLFRRSR